VHNGEASLQQTDTTSKARERQLQLLRAMSQEDRLAQACSMSESTRELSLAGLQRLHPQDTELELRVRLATFLYGPAAAERIRAGLARRQR
jgi:hypothetical protein